MAELKYANVIVDISLEKLDKTFQYRIPEDLQGKLAPGTRVNIPFGSRRITGYVTQLTDTPEYDEEKMREILSVSEGAVPIESQLIQLAAWMKETYGCTMNQALKTVLPSKKKVHSRKTQVPETPLPEVVGRTAVLNLGQREAIERILAAYPKPALLFGVTGSGKTEVYMELIEEMRHRGKQTILLIPEISLTYQNLQRFYRRFGDRVSVVNSRLSAGEKYDRFEMARRGEIDVMIGPRSALFTPFRNLGMIIVDEEHEGAYVSETAPRYRAGEVALARAQIAGAGVVFGSATPSLECYTKALADEYLLCRLPQRAKENSVLPSVEIVDLREELRAGNKTIFSRSLAEAMRECLDRKEQMMLFLNRRGYAGFISCRSCGTVIKCPHCDVSLTSHRGGSLVCHYCGYTRPLPDRCPACGSPYIAGFGLGTQKAESMVRKYFPEARILRMDLDTTSKKDGHSRILSAFAAGEADILLGTQMIVKGHDFPRVTLVGVLAADLSLYSEDFRASERTFQLLTQAAGRAGRAETPGRVIIQTYNPENYAIQTASRQDYEEFYRREMEYRRLMEYPPVGSLMGVLMSGPEEESLAEEAERLAAGVRRSFAEEGVRVIGPAAAGIAKIQDRYRIQMYVRHPERSVLMRVRTYLEAEKLTAMQADIW